MLAGKGLTAFLILDIFEPLFTYFVVTAVFETRKCTAGVVTTRSSDVIGAARAGRL